MKAILKTIVFCFILLLSLNLIGLYFAKGTHEKSLRRTIFIEFYRYSIQLSFITVAGAVLISEYNRRRQRVLELEELRKDMYKSLVEIYLKTKCIRWELRAYHNNNTINFETYTGKMKEIIEIKSNIEVLTHEITHYGKPVEKIGDELIRRLNAMEAYLRDLLDEFNTSEKPENKLLQTKDLIHLKGFVEKRKKDSKEMTQFTLHYREHFNKALILFASKRNGIMDDMNDLFVDTNKAKATAPISFTNSKIPGS